MKKNPRTKAKTPETNPYKGIEPGNHSLSSGSDDSNDNGAKEILKNILAKLADTGAGKRNLSASDTEADKTAPVEGNRAYVTVVKTKQPCGKHAMLKDGDVEWTSRGNVVEGVARCLHVPTAEALATVLGSLSDHEYIIPDFVPEYVDGSPFNILTQATYRKRFPECPVGSPVSDRSQRYVALAPNVWSFGAWRVLDRDIDANTPAALSSLDYDAFLNRADQLIPGLMLAPRVHVPSSKGRVRQVGGTVAERPNSHTWVMVADPELTNIARSRVMVNAFSLGLGWKAQRKSATTGEVLPGPGVSKTLIDMAVWTDHRIIYGGAPSVGAGLELLPASITPVEGTPLLLAAVPVPNTSAIKQLNSATGLQARITPAGRVEINDTVAMTLSSEIELLGKEPMSVADFLRDPGYAFDAKVRCQAMFRDSTSINGIIRKFKDGRVMHHDNGTGITYFLSEIDWRFLVDRFRAGDDPTHEHISRGFARYTDATWGLWRNDIKVKGEFPTLGAVDALRRAGKQLGPANDEYTRARIEAETAEFERAIMHRRNVGSVALETLEDGREIYTELMAHWWLTLQATGVVACRFKEKSDGLLQIENFAPKALAEYVANRMCQLPDGTYGNPVFLWMKSEKRQGVEEVVFEPGLAVPRGTLNLWHGFAVDPSDASGCALFIDHINSVIAGGDEVLSEYLLNWLAFIVQGITNRNGRRHMLRTGIAIVLRSKQGTGKSILGEYFARLFGHHAHVTASGQRIGAQFNWELANKVFMCADEAAFSGDRKLFSMLKAFITDRTFEFEKKFADTVRLSNYISMMMTTNENWAVPADVDDRRFCVIDVSPSRKGDKSYFNALAAEMDGVGPGALLSYLMARDISQFDPREYPKTNALLDQKMLTFQQKDPVAHWLHQCLSEGIVDLRYGNGFGSESCFDWPQDAEPTVSRLHLEAKLLEISKNNKHWTPPSRDSIGKRLREIFHGGVKTIRESRNSQREWRLPALLEARAAFEAVVGHKIVWPAVEDKPVTGFDGV